MAAKTKKRTEKALSEETIERLLHFIQESGPAGVNRSVIDIIIDRHEDPPRPGAPARIHSLIPDENRDLAWRYLEELMRRGEIDEKNRGGAQPWYVGIDQTRFRLWEAADRNEEAKQNRREERKERRKREKEDAKNAVVDPVKRAGRIAGGRTAASGSWTVERDGQVIWSGADKKKARGEARKAVKGGGTITIKDGNGNVTNTYGG